MLTAEGLDGIALRYSVLYGPEPASDALIDGLRKRKLPVVRNSGCCRACGGRGRARCQPGPGAQHPIGSRT